MLQTVIKNTQKLLGREIGIYKICVLSAAMLISIIAPVIISASVWLYVVLAVALGTISITTLVKKEGNYIKDVLLGKRGKEFFQRYNVWDFAIFELTMFSFGLLLMKLFPSLRTISIDWYIIICAASAGYMIAKIFTKNKAQ